MAAEILEFPHPDLTDMPRMLRALADGIERGEHEGAQFVAAVVAFSDRVPQAFAWGKMTALEVVGALTAAQREVMRSALHECG